MRKGIRWRFGYLVVAALLLLVGCQSNQTASNTSSGSKQEKLKIVTTFYPVAAITNAIVGDHADVEMLIKGNNEAHEFEPSAKDMAQLEEANVFIYSGDAMENWVPSTLKSISNKNLRVVEASKDVKPVSATVTDIEGKELTHEDLEAAEHAEEGDSHDADSHEEHGDHEDVDPHTWLDPKNAQLMTKTILEALKEADPDHAEVYQSNADAFIKKLETLDNNYKEAFTNASNKIFVTQHAAFNYLAHDYGLTQIAVTGVFDVSEPSPARLAALQDYIKKNDVKVIYVQEGTSDKIAQTLKQGDDAIQLSTLNSLETTQEGESVDGDTFVAKLQENLDHLKLAIN